MRLTIAERAEKTIAERAEKWIRTHAVRFDVSRSAFDRRVRTLTLEAYAAGWEAAKRDTRNGGKVRDD